MAQTSVWKYNGNPVEATSSWLAASRPQRVDMMQHLCASEHFLIDGDSLLVEALLNEHCDWELTQPLHIVYQAESMVARFRRLGGQFTITFFQQNTWWWTNKPQFELARTLLLQRLIALADQPNSKFSVAVFQDYTSTKFAPFCAHVRPEFALLSDGCQFDQLLDASVAKEAAACVRAFAMYLNSSRLHVAFTSRHDNRNNTVYVFSVRATPELQESTDVDTLIEDVSEGFVKKFNTEQVRPRATAPSQDAAQKILQHCQSKSLTARDAVTLLALSTMLADKKLAADSNMVNFAKVHLLCNAVQSMLPLSKRALSGGKSATVKAYLDIFSAYANPVAFGLPSIVPATAASDDYADSIDGHLFARVAELCQKNVVGKDATALFGDDVVKAVSESWAVIAEFAAGAASSPIATIAKFTDKENIFEVQPAAPVQPVPPAAETRNISLVKSLLGADAAKNSWNDTNLPLKASGWKQTLPGGALVRKLDEYKEVDNLNQDLITKFVRDQRASAESMNVKKVELSVIGKPGDADESGKNAPKKISESSLVLQYQNTLKKEILHAGNFLMRLANFEIDARKHTLNPKSILAFLDDVAEDTTPTDDELKRFKDFIAGKKTTEHKFLFVDHMGKVEDKNKSMDAPVLDKIPDKDMDVKLKLVAFVFFRRHCALRAMQLWLYQLWCEWDEELREANDAARLPNMRYLVQLYLELQKFMGKLVSFQVSLDSKILSTVCAMVGTLNFGESYQELIIKEISDTVQGGNFRPEPIALPNATELDLILKKFSPWSPSRFQLCVMGELLERARGIPDKRMPFPLDPWQKKLLDAVDEGYSAVVTAPTSSGKTFIALYAMTQTLRNSNTDVVVYVCPNRALVNQALSDSYARFGHKDYGKSGTAVCGVLGGGSAEDGYVMLPFNCQVLVTVPEVLEVILMSPIHQEWAQRIKFVVFDEIHSIESSADGAIWERLLMAVKCPFVALSATLGNTDELVGWLNRTRDQIKDSKPVIVVPGPGDAKIDRFNDIEKHIVLAEPAEVTTVSTVPKDYGFSKIHPLSCIGFEMLRSKGVEDLRLVPSEAVELYDALQAVVNSDRLSVFAQSQSGLRVLESLAALEPDTYFAGRRIITKQQARKYEDAVVRTLCNWAEVADMGHTQLVSGLDPNVKIPLNEEDHHRFYDMVQGVLAYFTSGLVSQENKLIEDAEARKVTEAGPCIHPESFEYVKSQLLPLLITLHDRRMTPCIAFTFTEEDCEAAVDAMVESLERAEQNFRNSTAFEEWVTEERAKFEAAQRETADQSNAAMRTERKTDAEGNVVIEQVENQQELKEYVVPEVLPMFSFKARFSKVKQSDWQQFLRTIEVLGLKENILRALKRGIAVHHNGISGRIRRLIERMFRQLAIPVIVSTETLALGIHSPCKTCVIAGDNSRLTTSQFRQMSGRAGRRGEDFLGHCIFLGVSLRRIQRLLTSDLDRLKGHVTIDATTILRLESLINFAPELYRANVEQLLRQLYVEPLLLEGRARLPQNTFDKFTQLWSRSILNWAAETGFISSSSTSMSTIGALVTRVTATLREVHAGPGAFVFAFLLASGALHSATAHFPAESDEAVTAMYQICSLLFSSNCDFNIPIEIHESILEDSTLFDQSTRGPGKIPKRAITSQSECRHAIVLPTWKELLGGALQDAVQKYNRRVLQCAVDALKATNTSLQVPEKAGMKLPLSEEAYSGATASAAWEKNEAASKIASLSNAGIDVRNPFSALSGATDRFSNVEDLTRNLRDGLYVDVQMLPTLDLSDSGRHDGRDSLMNAAVTDYLVHGYQNVNGKPSRKFLHEYNGLTPRDSWYTLIRHFKTMNSIVDYLGKEWCIAPGDVVEVEKQSIFNTDDHVMVALLAYQDQLTHLASSIAFQSASVRQFQDAIREAERANRRANRGVSKRQRN